MDARRLEPALTDALAQFVEANDCVTLMQVARFLEGLDVPWRGEVNLALADDRNVLLWSGMSQQMCDLLMRLVDDRRIYLHRSSVAAYHLEGGVLDLPLADAPRPGGLRAPHWLPVALRPVPPAFALH